MVRSSLGPNGPQMDNIADKQTYTLHMRQIPKFYEKTSRSSSNETCPNQQARYVLRIIGLIIFLFLFLHRVLFFEKFNKESINNDELQVFKEWFYNLV